MIDLKQLEVWFLTGSQHLYGPEALKQVAVNSQQIVSALDSAKAIPVRVVFKPVIKTPEEAATLCQQANSAGNCIGVITWCHTFSPSKMWINGLKILRKPILHLHTQFNRDIPWSSIDMDFMNLNQAAHGDREHGFIMSRLRLNRKVVVGYWKEADVQQRIGSWARAAAAWHDWQGARFVRFGDNMREVAVTEGDKVAAQVQFGYSVNTHGVGDLVKVINEVSDKEISTLVKEYEASYSIAPKLRSNGTITPALKEAARIELGLRHFLKGNGGYKGFTDTFEDLHGMVQLPGVAAQRLMADGYGFGGEGDWKTSALVRAMKVMATGLKGGTSFMEDYTYHLDPKGMLVLGAHMLEICPSIARSKPSLEVHPLGIGGKADPVRLVFDTPPGPALNASIVHLGNRFRLLVNEVDVVAPKPLPKLPVARALWKCRPDLQTAAAAWIYAGGAHHTGFSQAVTTEMMEDFAAIAGVELAVIDGDTRLRRFKQELNWSEAYYALRGGLVA